MMSALYARRARRWLRMGMGTASAALALLVSGCGKSDEPLTAASSKYEVGEDSPRATSKSAEPAGHAPAGDAPAEPAPESQPAAAQPARSTPRAPASTPRRPTAPRGSSDEAEAAPTKPPAISRQELDRLEVPEGPPETLWAFIEEVSKRQPRGTTQQQIIDDARNILQARITAAERILAHPDASSKLRRQSAEIKLISLQDLISQLGVTEAQEHLVDFCDALAKDKDPELAALGRMLKFSLQVGDLVEGRTTDPAPLLAEAKLIADEEPKNEETFQHLRSAALEMIQAGHKAEGLELVEHIITTFEAVNLPRLQQQLTSLREQAHFLELELPQKLTAFIQQQPDTLAPLQEAAQAMLTKPHLGPTTLEHAEFIGGAFERQNQNEAAKALYEQVSTAYQSSDNPELAKRATEIVGWAERRMELLGKPISLDGKLADGTELNWAEFQKDKVVLVTFWSANNREFFEREVPRLNDLHKVHKAQGFEILGVNVDQDAELMKRFLNVQPLPWPTVLDGTEGDRQLVDRFGVRSIPFNMLIDRTGAVVALHVNAHTLPEKLLPLLGGQPAAPEQPAEQSRRFRRAESINSFVAAEAPADTPSSGKEASPNSDADDEAPAAEPNEAKETTELEDESNPYLAPSDYDRQQLADFLLAMEEKPQTIRARPGFDEALVEAADRILAGGDQDAPGILAVETKLATLQRLASNATQDRDQADERLWTFLETVRADTRPKIARRTRCLLLEKEVLAVDDLPLEQVPELLTRLATFYSEATLDEQHLRMASGTVHAINRLDVEEREPYFQQFGKLFAASKDRDLARYGRRIAQLKAAPSEQLVGRDLQLHGITALGIDFDWESYRGKVVLVDFWATWCGPCRKETPHLKALYEKYQARGFDVVGVNLDTEAEDFAKYLEEESLPWTNLVGEQAAELAAKYDVQGVPTLLLVAPDGKVAAVAHQSADLVTKLEALLPKP